MRKFFLLNKIRVCYEKEEASEVKKNIWIVTIQMIQNFSNMNCSFICVARHDKAIDWSFASHNKGGKQFIGEILITRLLVNRAC